MRLVYQNDQFEVEIGGRRIDRSGTDNDVIDLLSRVGVTWRFRDDIPSIESIWLDGVRGLTFAGRVPVRSMYVNTKDGKYDSIDLYFENHHPGSEALLQDFQAIYDDILSTEAKVRHAGIALLPDGYGADSVKDIKCDEKDKPGKLLKLALPERPEKSNGYNNILYGFGEDHWHQALLYCQITHDADQLTLRIE